MHSFKGESLGDIYSQVIPEILNKPQFICKPRDQKIHEFINVNFELTKPKKCLFKNKWRSSPLKYICHELLLYYAGVNDGKYFEKASKFWGNLFNNDGTVNSAYGYLIFNKKYYSSWMWAIESLRRDKDSRQAIIHYNTPDYNYTDNKDYVCTLFNQFFIRDNKLYLIYNIRSNDLHFGVPADIVWGYTLMECMRYSLLDIYPDLKLGSYIHQIGSLHLYERNFEQYKKMITEPIESKDFFDIDVNLSEYHNRLKCKNIIESDFKNIKKYNNVIDKFVKEII